MGGERRRDGGKGGRGRKGEEEGKGGEGGKGWPAPLSQISGSAPAQRTAIERAHHFDVHQHLSQTRVTYYSAI